MAITTLLNTLLLITCASENLLANPGFEETNIDLPKRWDLYLLPQHGATGKLDNTAYAGKFSVFLNTPTPYEKEPVNNWSQNIIADLAGKTLLLSGYIKVEDAKEAAIWVQCWQKRPWGVRKFITTSTDAPLYGTKDWELVEATFQVPKGTDFITVRCVLLGTGAAWFDDISITIKKSTQSKKIKKEENAEKDNAKEPKENSDATTQDNPKPTTPIPTAQQDEINKVQSELAQFRKANLSLAEGVQGIQTSNKELLLEILRLQIQLEELRKQVTQNATTIIDPEKTPTKQTNATTPQPTTTKPVPILVPHKNDESKIQ